MKIVKSVLLMMVLAVGLANAMEQTNEVENKSNSWGEKALIVAGYAGLAFGSAQMGGLINTSPFCKGVSAGVIGALSLFTMWYTWPPKNPDDYPGAWKLRLKAYLEQSGWLRPHQS